MVGEKVLGVIATYHPTRDYVYSGDDLAVLQGMANQAAIALDNARLFDIEKKALAALREEQTKRLAAERWKTLGQATTNLAHRMNNLAGIIPVCVQRTRERVEYEPTVAKNLNMIEQQANFLLRLSDSLLKPFAPSELRRFDVNALMGEALAVTRPMLEERGIQVTFHRGKNIPPKIRIRGLLSEAFVELITNAAKAMPEGGQLTIETKLSDGNVVETVFTDTGCGIPAERQSRVFELFGRGSEPTKEEAERPDRGIGFGLWWVRTFLQQWGGDVILQRSEVGKGSTLIIRLPVEG
jgi:signal transduction histidine kinase